MTQIRRYSDDFKRNALQYLEDHPNMSVKQVADYLGIPEGTLYGWVKAHRRKLRNDSIDPAAPLTDQEKELARLRRENRDLHDALTVLKKAISILND